MSVQTQTLTQTRYTTGISLSNQRFSEPQGADSRSVSGFQPKFEDNRKMVGSVTDLVKKSNQRLNEKLAYLSQGVCTELAEIDFIKQGVEKLGHEIGQLKGDLEDNSVMETLQNQVDELCEEWKGLRGKGNNSEFGLVGVYVEQAICSHVLPEVYMSTKCASLHDLLDILNDNEPFPLDPDKCDCEKILDEATERWGNLCKALDFPNEWITKTGGWSIYDCTVPNDIRAIEILKLSRVSVTYQEPVSLKHAEQHVESLKDEMPLSQFNLVAPFIGSLRDKMIKNGLCHDKLLLY